VNNLLIEIKNFEQWFEVSIIKNGNSIERQIKYKSEGNHYIVINPDELEPDYVMVNRQCNLLNKHWQSWQARAKFDVSIGDFDSVADLAIKYLAENHHPHTTMIVTATDVEVAEGVKCYSNDKYLVD
jgi:thiamine pyrophosphokinase